LTLKKRAVTIDRQLTYMELSFIYVKGEDEFPVLNLYLDRSGVVWRDLEEQRFCDYNNLHLAGIVRNELTVAVLNSSISSPSKSV
jgi:hypothetical protein